MVNGIGASEPHGRSLKFLVGSQDWQETMEEGQRTYQLKCCEYYNKDEDNSLQTLNDKNSNLKKKMKYQEWQFIYT